MNLYNVIHLSESTPIKNEFTVLYDRPEGSLYLVITERGFHRLRHNTEWNMSIKEYNTKRKNSILWIWKAKSGDNYQIWTTHKQGVVIVDGNGHQLSLIEMESLLKVEPLSVYILPFLTTYTNKHN